MKSSDIKNQILAEIKLSNSTLPIVETKVSTSNIDKVIESENQKINAQTMWDEDGIISNNEEE